MLDKQTLRIGNFATYYTSIFILLMIYENVPPNFASAQSNIHYINWNTSNPLFKEYGNNVIEINAGTEDQPWSYEQANIICPRYSASLPTLRAERYIIYNVTKTEFEHCQVINPQQNKIVAVCNTPYQLTFFTLTFRAFSPVPGAFEFHPGETYYFISTSSKRNLYKHSGGRCATHNMRLVFRIRESDNTDSNLEQDIHENTFLNHGLTNIGKEYSETKKKDNDMNQEEHRDYNEYYNDDITNHLSNEYDRPEAVQSNVATSNLCVLFCDPLVSVSLLTFSTIVSSFTS